MIFRFYYKIYSISILSIIFLARPLYRERLKRIIASIVAFAVAHIHAHIYTRTYTHVHIFKNEIPLESEKEQACASFSNIHIILFFQWATYLIIQFVSWRRRSVGNKMKTNELLSFLQTQKIEDLRTTYNYYLRL